jgi:Etoposide-induced protein 2.4 (EI24)
MFPFQKKIAASTAAAPSTKPMIEPIEQIEPISQAGLVYKALFKTTLALFNPKLWLLSLIPLAIAAALWLGIGFFSWDIITELLRDAVSGIETPTWLPAWFPSRATWVNVAVLLTTLPLVSISALVLANLFSTQTVIKRVAKQYHAPTIAYTALENSANTVAGVWHSAWILTTLGVLWLLSLPTWFIAGLGFVIQLLLMAWANTRLLSRDVLVDFADKDTRDAVLKTHRSTLFTLGLIASVPAFLPSILWLGGAIVVVALPVMALLGVWLSIMVCLITAVLFSHYLIPALLHHQREQAALKAQLDIQQHGIILEGTFTDISNTNAGTPAISHQAAATPAIPL